MINKIKLFLIRCKKSNSNAIFVALRYLYYKIRRKNILATNRVLIKGLENIEIRKLLHIGMESIGFIYKYERTYFNVRGKLIFKGSCSIGRGCRLDIGENAVAKFGNSSSINVQTTFIIMHGIDIGDNTTISWGCEFLDDDFHEISYVGQKKKEKKIEIGDHVWIGSNVKIYKGCKIPNGSVVAAGSIVTQAFDEENTLIAGIPAKIIKTNISWK